MSLSSILSIARSALSASQRQLDVTGHNIANASTEGYSRQRVRLSASSLALPAGIGHFGLGVEVEGIDRVRSTLLDAAFRRESSALGQQTVLRDTLGQVDSVVGDLSAGGLSATLDAFWSAWNGLAVSPNDRSSRLAVQSRGQQLANQLNGVHGRLADLATFGLGDLRTAIDQTNRDLARLADLNARIVSAGPGGRSAPDLLDERDRVIDRLATLLPVTVVERQGGGIALLAGDSLLVDAGYAAELAIDAKPGGGYALTDSNSGRAVDPRDGRIEGILTLINTTLPGFQRQLDDLARAIVTEVNALHRTGLTVAGIQDQDFFDPFGTSAGTIRLSQGVELSANSIAAGTTGTPGDGTLAQAISDLRAVPVATLGDRTPGAFYADLVASVGIATADATRLAASHEVLASQAATLRSSVSGVSLDEELVGMITHQQAFSAAARLVSVADDMVQDLLRMV